MQKWHYNTERVSYKRRDATRFAVGWESQRKRAQALIISRRERKRERKKAFFRSSVSDCFLGRIECRVSERKKQQHRSCALMFLQQLQ